MTSSWKALLLCAVAAAAVLLLAAPQPSLAQRTGDRIGSAGDLPSANSIAAVSSPAQSSGGDNVAGRPPRPPKPVPEPATMTLMGLGAAALLGRTLLKRKQAKS